MKRIKLILIFSAIILIWAIFSLVKLNTGPGAYEEFAKCITDSGLKMYGTSWCGYCNQQKELFGRSFQYIDFTDCDKEKEICQTEGISGYPTWKLNNQTYSGMQSLSSLEALSGCTK